MTSKELIEQLEKDPQYQAMMAEKAKRRAEMESLLQSDEAPLLAALERGGWPAGVRQCGPTRSVWDLVNTAVPYANLIPILADHLPRQYHFRTREGIARALSVIEARGAPARVVLDELKKLVEPKDPSEEGYRFALANALVTIGAPSMEHDIRRMLNDPRFASVHLELKRVAKAIAKRAAIEDD
jgi:hypothetical protein